MNPLAVVWGSYPLSPYPPPLSYFCAYGFGPHCNGHPGKDQTCLGYPLARSTNGQATAVAAVESRTQHLTDRMTAGSVAMSPMTVPAGAVRPYFPVQRPRNTHSQDHPACAASVLRNTHPGPQNSQSGYPMTRYERDWPAQWTNIGCHSRRSGLCAGYAQKKAGSRC